MKDDQISDQFLKLNRLKSKIIYHTTININIYVFFQFRLFRIMGKTAKCSVHYLSPRSQRRRRSIRVNSLLKKYHNFNKAKASDIVQSEIVNFPPIQEEPEACERGCNSLKHTETTVNVKDNTKTSHSSNLDDTSRSLVKIKQWAIKNNVTRTATNQLLSILKNHTCFSDFPGDSRTLLKSASEFVVSDTAGGQFVYLGISDSVKQYISKTTVPDSISLQFNIDGIPLYKSSSLQFWPILGAVCNTNYVFAVAVYCAKHKPDNLDEYFEQFILEVNKLQVEGLQVGGRRIKINIGAFICDAPARAFICGIKGHTGYYACGKCEVKGKREDQRTVYIKTSATLRTDESFRSQSQSGHHNVITPLLQLNFDIIACFPFEYMHLVCLGVTRKLLHLWTSGPRCSFRLSQREIESISVDLELHQNTFTTEFARKPRSLKELDRWKATELRSFLLYVGPVVLRKILAEPLYKHFLTLHAAIRLLCVPHQNKDYINYAEELLVYFVKEFKVHYGRKYMSYNIHGLIHLANDVRVHGHLDNFSAFKFENFLGFTKRLVRSPKQPIKQVVRQLLQRKELTLSISAPESIAAEKTNRSLKTVCFNQSKLSCTYPNNFVLLTDKCIGKIENIYCENGDIYLNISVVSVSSISNYPCESAIIGGYKINITQTQTSRTVKLEDVVQKCVVFQTKSNKFMVYTILHSKNGKQ